MRRLILLPLPAMLAFSFIVSTASRLDLEVGVTVTDRGLPRHSAVCVCVLSSHRPSISHLSPISSLVSVASRLSLLSLYSQLLSAFACLRAYECVQVFAGMEIFDITSVH